MKIGFSIWQYSNSLKVPGISGEVDGDFCPSIFEFEFIHELKKTDSLNFIIKKI